ncbi:hypothetical protein C8R44DRAFT_878917 [Mycena epipterygia]|nr:hypothetical protein C8R44DRAFT_878917 [Mycena epipterygia]
MKFTPTQSTLVLASLSTMAHSLPNPASGSVGPETPVTASQNTILPVWNTDSEPPQSVTEGNTDESAPPLETATYWSVNPRDSAVPTETPVPPPGPGVAGDHDESALPQVTPAYWGVNPRDSAVQTESAVPTDPGPPPLTLTLYKPIPVGSPSNQLVPPPVGPPPSIESSNPVRRWTPAESNMPGTPESTPLEPIPSVVAPSTDNTPGAPPVSVKPTSMVDPGFPPVEPPTSVKPTSMVEPSVPPAAPPTSVKPIPVDPSNPVPTPVEHSSFLPRN